MMKVVGWMVWMDTQAIYDSRIHKWEDVPDDGIGIMVTYKEGGYREIFQGHDHYFHAPGGVIGLNDDTVEEIKARYPGAIVKKGIWLESEAFYNLQQTVLAYKWTW